MYMKYRMLHGLTQNVHPSIIAHRYSATIPTLKSLTLPFQKSSTINMNATSYVDTASHEENTGIGDTKAASIQVEDCEKAVNVPAEDVAANHEEPPVIASSATRFGKC
jgi:hypothetical protein